MLNALFIAGLSVCLAVTLVTLVLATRATRVMRQAFLWLLLAGNLSFLAFSLVVCIGNTEFNITLYRLAPALQFAFFVDRLAAFFIIIISLVATCVSLYSLRYVEHHGTDTGKNLLVAMMSLFILAMVLVVASANTFAFLFFWEVMSVTSFLLVLNEREKPETQKSALFYFIMTQMSTVFLMFGFLAISKYTGSFDIAPVTGIPPALQTAAFLSLFIGFGIKAGMMPFHKWLPYAHSASPSNISALMSGVMIKVAIYGLVRYVVNVLTPDRWWGILILLFATFSAVFGVIYALKEHDIKKLLAYHSIENIGIILIGVGLYLIFQSYGLTALATLSLLGGLFHTLNHALFKSLLFLTAGAVVNATGTRDIDSMGGLMKSMPYTGVIFLVGSVSIAALPPLNGFASELMIFQAFLQSFIITDPSLKIILFLGLSLFALTSALAAACFVKAFGIIFLASPRSEQAKNAREVSPFMTTGAGILAILCVLLGVFYFQIFTSLGYDLPVPNMAVVGLLLVLALGIVWIIMRLVAKRKVRVSETWGCGITSQNSRMEYTAAGFSEPILTIFRPVYRTQKKVERTYHDDMGSIFKEGKAEIHLLKVYEEKIYMPVARFVSRLSILVSNRHDVDLDVYILYSFIAIIILILIMGWFI
jgi:hydrogenase-4 component B